ncbi:MAG: hypothetical protein Q4G04_04110 [bacterium]|nr:hypothetical protein [bacterium]
MRESSIYDLTESIEKDILTNQNNDGINIMINEYQSEICAFINLSDEYINHIISIIIADRDAKQTQIAEHINNIQIFRATIDIDNKIIHSTIKQSELVSKLGEIKKSIKKVKQFSREISKPKTRKKIK